MAVVIRASEDGAIDRAAQAIRRGGLVAFPTETVYGLGADAHNPEAVARIFEAKRRPYFDPLIVHIPDRNAAEACAEIPVAATGLFRFWPGPLTMVMRKKALIPPIVTAGLETVGLRVPGHPVALALLRAAGKAIAAPSANLFGYVSPTTAEHVTEQLGDSIDIVLDGGPCPVGVESTIIALDGPLPRILRQGGLPLEDLVHILGSIEVACGTRIRPEAPGQLSRHYATRTPLHILSEEGLEALDIARGEAIGLLALREPSRPERFRMREILSDAADLREAAANLFAALHRLDAAGLDRIIALPVPEQDLGRAIMDRLRRCAAGRL